jgi:hypothetical protein
MLHRHLHGLPLRLSAEPSQPLSQDAAVPPRMHRGESLQQRSLPVRMSARHPQGLRRDVLPVNLELLPRRHALLSAGHEVLRQRLLPVELGVLLLQSVLHPGKHAMPGQLLQSRESAGVLRRGVYRQPVYRLPVWMSNVATRRAWPGVIVRQAPRLGATRCGIPGRRYRLQPRSS